MIQVPIRGIIALRQALLLIGVSTLVPHVIKASKPVAKAVGDKLIEWGEWLKEDQPQPEPAEEMATTEEKPKNAKPKSSASRGQKPADPKPKTPRKKSDESDSQN